MIAKRSPYYPWTDEQSALAVYLYYQGKTMKAIGVATRHTKASVWTHLKVIEFGAKQHVRRHRYIRLRPASGERPTENAIQERDRRLSVPHISIGAALFGDPPPGYSALDRRA